MVLSAKLLGGAVHSLATWEDKLGIGEKITDASELISAFGQELKYEWENPEEYRERVEKAQALRKELDQAERALNAEAYHNQDDRELGYWSGAALQTVFGEEIIKQVAKGVSTTAKAAKVAGSAGKKIGKARGVGMSDVRHVVVRKSVTMTTNMSDNIMGGTFKYTDKKVTEFLANRHVVNHRLELTDMVFYPRNAVGNELKNAFGGPAMLESLEAIKDHARSQGFKQVRIHFQRSANSSSSKPGKIFDRTFDL